MSKNKFYIWHNQMCISYLLRLKQIENYFIANDWEKSDDQTAADAIVIGACAAFLPYFKTYVDKIKDVSALKGDLIVYGCLPTVNNRFYKENTPARAHYVPSRFPERIEKAFSSMKVPWSEIPFSSVFRREDYVDYNPKKSFILIQEGCNETCVYCPHRLGIGREKSRLLDDIVKQVRNDVSNGIKTFILEGNNGGSWGQDLRPALDYRDLLDAILKVGDKFEVHIGDFAPKWVKKFQEQLLNPRITDIKIPIQTTSPSLLKTMGRDPFVTEMAPILERLKNRDKPPLLRTEVIIGFPTSTREELLDTLNFASRYFNKIACFSYDYHPSTKIAKMGLPFIEDEEIGERIKIAINFFKDKPGVTAVFDNRGRVCDKYIAKFNEHKNENVSQKKETQI